MESDESKLFEELEKEIKKPHKKYSIDFKLKVIKLSKMNISIHSISNKLGIDRKLIRDWIKNEINLNNIPNKDRRYRACKTSGLIKDFSDEEEEKIFIWIKEKRDNKYPVSAKSILAFASSLKNSFSYKKIDAQMR